RRPTYRRLRQSLRRDELAAALAGPEVRAAILDEDDLPPDPKGLFETLGTLMLSSLDRVYPLGEPPDYEPTPDRAVAAMAKAGGARLLQDASGYVETIVSGEVTRRDGVDTGARPGALVRGAR